MSDDGARRVASARTLRRPLGSGSRPRCLPPATGRAGLTSTSTAVEPRAAAEAAAPPSRRTAGVMAKLTARLGLVAPYSNELGTLPRLGGGTAREGGQPG